MLDTSEASVNSLLRRARAAFESRLPATGRDRAPLPNSSSSATSSAASPRRRERRHRRDGRAADRRRVADDAAPALRVPGPQRDRRVPARPRGPARRAAAAACRPAPTASRRSAATSQARRPTSRAVRALRPDPGGRPDLRHHLVRRQQRLPALRPAADAAGSRVTCSAHSARRTRAARARAAPAPTTSARRPGPRPSCSPARPASRRRARWRRARGAGAGSSGATGAGRQRRGVGAEDEVEHVARVADDRGAGVQQLVRARRVARRDRAGHRRDHAAEVGREVGGDQRPGPRRRLDHDRDRRERGDDPVAGREAPAVGGEAGRHLRHDRTRRDQPRVQAAHPRGIRRLRAAGQHGDRRAADASTATGARREPRRRAATAPQRAGVRRRSIPSAMPGDDRQPRGGEAAAERARDLEPVGRGPARADDRDRLALGSAASDPATWSTAGGSGSSRRRSG